MWRGEQSICKIYRIIVIGYTSSGRIGTELLDPSLE
jgi:hypothetical protein